MSGGRAHAVIAGAGIMGIGLARWLQAHSCDVTLVDPAPVALAQAREALDPDGLVTAEDWPDRATADVVIEAVTEDAAIKRDVLARIEAALPRRTPVLSNTSGLSVAALANGMAWPERFLVAHFFNPADVIPAVEVVPGPATDPAVVAQVSALLRALGKRPAVLRREVPGFVANRVQHAIMRECLALLAAGVADPREIDDVVRWSIGVRLARNGPFLQRDLNGLDTHLAIARYLYPDLARDVAPSAELCDRVGRGDLGAKSGRGFYDWTDASTREARAEEADALRRIIAASAEDRSPPG